MFAHPRGRWLVATLVITSVGFAQDSRRNAALDQAVSGLQGQPSAAAPPSALRLIDISLDGLFSAGTSTERDRGLASLQAGGHDPRKRGFTVNNVELSALGAIDPWFNAESHIVWFLEPSTGESMVELEEAFLTTKGLPGGLQLKGGQFFTELGRHNAQHPHAWDWTDAPVIHTRVFGPDGMRGPGVRASWLAPVDWSSELIFGVQNANGETMSSFASSEESFGERPVRGRYFEEREVRSFRDVAWHARLQNDFDLPAGATASLGVSTAYGPNATGASSHTWIWGADLTLRWRPTTHFRGWPFVKWTTEVLGREYKTGEQIDENDPTIVGDEVTLPATTLRDVGFYSEALWGFSYGWAAGLRVEHAGGHGAPYDQGAHAFGARADDPLANDRFRLSPLLVWHPSEFSRVRFQYDWDRAEHLHANEAHSFWIAFEFMIGAHPAHKY